MVHKNLTRICCYYLVGEHLSTIYRQHKGKPVKKKMGFQAANKPLGFPTKLAADIIQVGQREFKKIMAFSSVTKVSCKKRISGFEVLMSLQSKGSFRGVGLLGVLLPL
jgi:hypothetical protein